VRPKIRYCDTPAGRVAYYDTDIRALLPQVRARRAVLHREADPGTWFELGREVAGLIPGATLLPLPLTNRAIARRLSVAPRTAPVSPR
jgi:hypothetical protein